MKTVRQLGALVTGLLVDHFSKISNEKHYNSRYPEFDDAWGVEHHGKNEVIVEVGDESYLISIKRERKRGG